jgi:hypothetical protein
MNYAKTMFFLCGLVLIYLTVMHACLETAQYLRTVDEEVPSDPVRITGIAEVNDV